MTLWALLERALRLRTALATLPCRPAVCSTWIAWVSCLLLRMGSAA